MLANFSNIKLKQAVKVSAIFYLLKIVHFQGLQRKKKKQYSFLMPNLIIGQNWVATCFAL